MHAAGTFLFAASLSTLAGTVHGATDGGFDSGINASSRGFAGRVVACYSVLSGKVSNPCRDDSGSPVAWTISAAADNGGTLGMAPQTGLGLEVKQDNIGGEEAMTLKLGWTDKF